MKIRAALWMLWVLLPVVALPKSHFVIVGGLGGEPRYEKQWADYVDNLEETRLKIRHRNLTLVARSYESLVEFSDRQQLVFLHRSEEIGRDPLAPPRTRLPLLIH